jgi:hypothetical protein
MEELKSEIQFSLISYELTKNLTVDQIKKNGIYFTPKSIIDITLDKIKIIMKKNKIIIKDILEPCCGSGEFLFKLDECFEKKEIDAYEKNSIIFEKTKDLILKNNNLKYENKDFFHIQENKKYDLIIGNPPYYVLSKSDVSEKYFQYFDGRPNIFILFLLDCLKKLNKNGLLAFILPINFLNCLYYDKTRNYIQNNYKIHEIISIPDCKFMKTKQDVFILIIENKISMTKNKDYVLKINKNTIFHEPSQIKCIKNYISECTFLNTLNFTIKVGNVIWNEHKKILTDNSDQTLLIYNSYFKKNSFEIIPFKNETKKNYIQRKGINKPVILINRGYGMGKYQFNYIFMNQSKEYCVENHCLILEYKGDKENEKLIEIYEKIITSFQDPRTESFIETYFKNNAMNCEEILNILPIYHF